MRALQEYRADYGSYPKGTNEDLIRCLQSARRGQDEPYYTFSSENLREGLIVDDWGQPYVYKSTGEAALIYSFGPNQVDDDGLGDDIRP
jgi:hypothetical protein